MTTLAEIVDKESIRELLARYCVLHAAHDFVSVAALFAQDGVFENIVGTFVGRGQIQRLYESINPDRAMKRERKHYTTDVVITMDGEQARVMSQFLLVRQHEASLIVAAAGRYEDLLARRTEGWCFARRKVHVDFHSDMGLKQSG